MDSNTIEAAQITSSAVVKHFFTTAMDDKQKKEMRRTIHLAIGIET